MARLAIGKNGTHIDIPLLLYQTKAKDENCHQGCEDIDEGKHTDESEGDQRVLTSASPSDQRLHDSQITFVKTLNSNSAKRRGIREEMPEKIDYCL